VYTHDVIDPCLICERIELIKKERNPFFVKELETGYVVLGDHQLFRGYTLFLCKKHIGELHDLDREFRDTFLREMSSVGEAVFHAFSPRKLNYELLGNSDPHLHWHIFPRHKDDSDPTKPVWCTPQQVRESVTMSDTELLNARNSLLKHLSMLT